jgi:hypothetical protein
LIRCRCRWRACAAHGERFSNKQMRGGWQSTVCTLLLAKPMPHPPPSCTLCCSSSRTCISSTPAADARHRNPYQRQWHPAVWQRPPHQVVAGQQRKQHRSRRALQRQLRRQVAHRGCARQCTRVRRPRRTTSKATFAVRDYRSILRDWQLWSRQHRDSKFRFGSGHARPLSVLVAEKRSLNLWFQVADRCHGAHPTHQRHS